MNIKVVDFILVYFYEVFVLEMVSDDVFVMWLVVFDNVLVFVWEVLGKIMVW